MISHGVELPGTAATWARKWASTDAVKSADGWRLSDLEEWIGVQASEFSDRRQLWKMRSAIAVIRSRLAVRVAQAGKKAGLWTFSGGRWRAA